MREEPKFRSSIVKVPAVVGMMSLIGVGHHRPCSWGNYFSLGGAPYPRVANMWAENLETLVKNGTLIDGAVKVKLYEDLSRQIEQVELDNSTFTMRPQNQFYAIVVDDRIPSDDWLYNKLCFTGCYAPHIDIIRDMYKVLGDPTNAIEKYEDPKSYYEKQGAIYDENTGIIRYNVKSESRPLKVGWTMEESSSIVFPTKTERGGTFYIPEEPK